jgi:hypothetical protein
MRFSYITRPELLGTEYMNKKEKENALLSQFMMDHDLYDDNLCKSQKEHGLSEHPPPAEDEQSTGLRKTTTDG